MDFAGPPTSGVVLSGGSMEREVEQEQIPLIVELMATHDRTCVTIMVRGNEKIPMSALIPALENFADQLRKKFTKSAIDVQKPKIIVP